MNVKKAWQLIHSPAVGLSPDKESFAAMVREALYTGKIIAYAQGFSPDAGCIQAVRLESGPGKNCFHIPRRMHYPGCFL